jgi:hypothetical protein
MTNVDTKSEDYVMKSTMLTNAFLAALALLGFDSAKAEINLGSASNFAVLGGTTVTSTGNTILNGNLGVAPGSAITGFPPGTVNGTIYTSVDGNGAVAQQAQNDASAAFNTLAGKPVTESLSGDMLGSGGTVPTLVPGVYFFSSSAQLTGQLILSGDGTYIFQIGSTLTTASSSSIVLANGALAADVYWQVGSSATLGTDTSFDGDILAKTSITMDAGAGLNGSALALNGAVTLNDNNITDSPASTTSTPVPEPTTVIAGALMLLPFGVSALRTLCKKRTA